MSFGDDKEEVAKEAVVGVPENEVPISTISNAVCGQRAVHNCYMVVIIACHHALCYGPFYFILFILPLTIWLPHFRFSHQVNFPTPLASGCVTDCMTFLYLIFHCSNDFL
jgi:hypothetical protein